MIPGAGSVEASTGPGHFFWESPEWSVRGALRRLHLARLAAAGRCPTERIGAVTTGGRHDPQKLIAEIAELSLFLRECTDDERYALEVEIGDTDLTVGHVRERDVDARRGRAYRVIRLTNKCERLSKATGARWYPRKYHTAVTNGFRKVERAMRLAGLL